MRYLTIGSCLKQEEDYIEDFIKIHRYLGVEHFVFLDREYNNLANLLRNYNDVEIIHFPECPENNHMSAWAKLIEHEQGRTKWLACIDADQVLIPAEDIDIKEILKEYEEFAGLYVNAWTFGTNFHKTKTFGSVYERFTKRAKIDFDMNRMVQFIVQPDKACPTPAANPHYPILLPDEIIVNTDKVPIGSLNQIYSVYDKLWLAHYVIKSEEEWYNKTAKGRADLIGTKMLDYDFQKYLANCNEEDEFRVKEIWQKINS